MAGPGSLAGDVFRFDAGPADSPLEPWAERLDRTSSYTPGLGFGWTRGPRSDFHRRELARSRTARTIDGVVGRRLSFRANLAAGTWLLTLWVEAGREDDSTLKIITQGQPRSTGWHAFRPPAEPRRSCQKIYRVYQETTTVGSEGFSCDLIGQQDEVRLLGFSLIRQDPPTEPDHRHFLRRLALADRYDCNAPLEDLMKRAEGMLRAHAGDAFFSRWQQQLELLVQADRFYSMRGWEWAKEKTGLGMFDRLRQAVMLLDGLLHVEGAGANLLAERARYLRGRILYWLEKEQHLEGEPAGGQTDLKKLYARHPDDKLLAMYTGAKIDLPDACDCLETPQETPSSAPAWSMGQREALCRLRQIAHWWVEQRQAPNGEFGGKLGDDVELLRWWAALILTGDETAKRGWQKLADGVWRSKYLHEGYTSELRDVEHAAEYLADTAPFMAMFSDDPIYLDRLEPAASYFEKRWTGRTPMGHRFFRSAWFSSTAIATEEPKGRDLEYNSRAVQAIRYLAWRRPSPQVIELLHAWAEAWVRAALRTDKGKPKGIVPASVRFPDEAFNGDGPTWYRANMFWEYYDWQHFAGSMMLDQLFYTYTITQDKRLLQPMYLSLDLIRAKEPGLNNNQTSEPEEGTPAWAAKKLMSQDLFWSVVEQWRFLSGDSRWDDLILRHGTPYGRFRIGRNEDHLVAGLNRLLTAVRTNGPLKTTEAMFTDRVDAPGSEHLKAMLTGDGIWGNLSPYYAVSWEQTDAQFTALVGETGVDRLQVQLYSHAPKARSIVMRLWQLKPGEYRLRLEPSGPESPEQTISERTISVRNRGERVHMTLPAKQLIRIRIDPLPSEEEGP